MREIHDLHALALRPLARFDPRGLRLATAGALLCLLLVLLATAPAAGIVIRHDRPDEAYHAAPEDFPTLVLINRPAGLGTLVTPTWVLTAGHVARPVKVGQEVTVAGQDVPVCRVVFHPGWRTPQTRGVDDVALIELERPVQGVEPTPLFRRRDEVGREAVFAGRGATGDGREGLEGFYGGYGELRRATNRIERADEQWIVFRFDPPAGATALEGISGPGDSGGPALVEVDGHPHLAGVSSWQDNREQGAQGVYGVLEHYARVSSYADWIDRVTGGEGCTRE